MKVDLGGFIGFDEGLSERGGYDVKQRKAQNVGKSK